MASDKPFRDILGKFRKNPTSIDNPNTVQGITDNDNRIRSESVANRPGAFANRTPRIDPAAARIAARTFVNRMDVVTKAPGHKLEHESNEAREKRIDRVYESFIDGTTSGEQIQDLLSEPIGDIQAAASEQGRRDGLRYPGQPPYLYK